MTPSTSTFIKRDWTNYTPADLKSTLTASSGMYCIYIFHSFRVSQVTLFIVTVDKLQNTRYFYVV